MTELKEEDGIMDLKASLLKSEVICGAPNGHAANSLDFIWPREFSKGAHPFMISDLTGIDSSAIISHYKDDEKIEELSEEDGLFEEPARILKDNILLESASDQLQTILDLYIPAKFGKKGSNSTLIYSDGKEYTLNNKTNTILSLKSVMKLMLMMTKTEVAKEFRNFVIDNLVLGETAQEIVEEY